MKKLLLTVALLLCNASIANLENIDQKSTSIFAKDPWEFLEQEFVKIPRSKATSIDKICIKTLVTIIPTFYVWIFSMLGFNLVIYSIARETFNIARMPQLSTPPTLTEIHKRLVFDICNIASTAMSFMPAGYAFCQIYKKIHTYIVTKVEEETLTSFIEHWQINKQRTPEEFHQDFEKLYIEFKKQSSTIDIKKVNVLLQKRIARHFGY